MFAQQDDVNQMLMMFVILHKYHPIQQTKCQEDYIGTWNPKEKKSGSLFGSFQGSHRGTQRLPVVSIIQGCSRISNDINRAAAVSSSPARPYNRQDPLAQRTMARLLSSLLLLVASVASLPFPQDPAAVPAAPAAAAPAAPAAAAAPCACPPAAAGDKY